MPISALSVARLGAALQKHLGHGRTKLLASTCKDQPALLDRGLCSNGFWPRLMLRRATIRQIQRLAHLVSMLPSFQASVCVCVPRIYLCLAFEHSAHECVQVCLRVVWRQHMLCHTMRCAARCATLHCVVMFAQLVNVAVCSHLLPTPYGLRIPWRRPGNNISCFSLRRMGGLVPRPVRTAFDDGAHIDLLDPCTAKSPHAGARARAPHSTVQHMIPSCTMSHLDTLQCSTQVDATQGSGHNMASYHIETQSLVASRHLWPHRQRIASCTAYAKRLASFPGDSARFGNASSMWESCCKQVYGWPGHLPTAQADSPPMVAHLPVPRGTLLAS